MDNNKKIIEKLTKYLLKCNFEYYNLNNSLITDLEYDSKLRELKILEEKYPNYKLKNTPTQNVGGFVNDNFVSKKHKYRLYSLQDIFSFSELEKFFKDTKKIIEHPVYSVELKIDGIAMVLNYKNGILDTAVTRGDAYIGEDVTENIKTIKSIPQYIKYEDDLEIRGEVYMPRESFEKYNDIIFNKKESLPKRVTNILKEYKIQENCVLKLYEENVIEDYIKIIKNNIKNFNDKEIRAYLKKEVSEISKINKEKMLSNPRNSASGSVRNLDTNITKNRNLSFIPYGTNIDGYNDINNNNSHLETVDYFVKELQFKKPITLKTNNEEEIRNFILSIENQRKDLPYDIDGIVVKVDDISFHEQIGYTAKFPK